MQNSTAKTTADYSNVTPQDIKIVPTSKLNHSFKIDYEDMAKSIIIGNPPTYVELEILHQIEENLTIGSNIH